MCQPWEISNRMQCVSCLKSNLSKIFISFILTIRMFESDLCFKFRI